MYEHRRGIGNGFEPECGDKLTFSHEKVVFRWPKIGEHGADLISLFMAGNLSLLEASTESVLLGLHDPASLFVTGLAI